MESYKIKKDLDEKNIDLKLNGLYKDKIKNDSKAQQVNKKYINYDEAMYNESVVGNKVSRMFNKKNRVPHMIGNKAVAFSSLVE